MCCFARNLTALFWLFALGSCGIVRQPRDWHGLPSSRILHEGSHPYHRVQPIELCYDNLGGALKQERVELPDEIPLGRCAWHLGGAERSTGGNISTPHPPNVGIRWLVHDVFARDRQLFAIVPQYARIGIRMEELKPVVRASIPGAPWHELLHKTASPALPHEQFPNNAWETVRWVLPREIHLNQFIEVAIRYGEKAFARRVWHADLLGSQLRSLQAEVESQQPEVGRVIQFEDSVLRNGGIDCVLYPGWNCIWPRVTARQAFVNDSSDDQPQPAAGTGDFRDPRPYKLMATTMMLLEDKERYMASWAAFHADRGVEAAVVYRNDDEWLQAACLLAEAAKFYCEGIQLDESRQAPLDPIADFMPGSSVQLCAAPFRLHPNLQAQCLQHVQVSTRRNPTVLELSWPFRKYNNHLDSYWSYRQESQPHAMAHFLFKYGKPLAEWMINMDVDEYINVTSFDRLIREADASASNRSQVPPGAISFMNRFAVASVKPAVDSGFSRCPPLELQLNSGAPLYQDMLHVEYEEANRPLALASMPRQHIPSVDAARLGDWAAVSGMRDRSRSMLLVKEARDKAWWRKSDLPDQYWPVYAASQPDFSAMSDVQRTFRSKWMARTDLVQTVMIHKVQLSTHPSPAARQWLRFASRSIPIGESNDRITVLELLNAPGKLPDERIDQVALYLQRAPEPQVVNADTVIPGACMLHIMEQSFESKLFQSLTASLLPLSEVTVSDCESTLEQADGLGPLPDRSSGGSSSCERAVRQAMFLRGYCNGSIAEQLASGKYWYLPPLSRPGHAELVHWAEADDDTDN